MSDGPVLLAFPKQPFRLGYRPWLDGLRGVAVLVVLAFHFDLVRGGFLGVDVFFVLSGFLITCLLIEEWQATGRIHLGRFYARRMLRLAPALATVLVVFYFVVWFSRPEMLETYRNAMLLAACYLSNWPQWISTPMWWLTHTWSLSVEEQFYLVWPIVLLAMLSLRVGRVGIAGVVVAGIAASAILRFVICQHAVSVGSSDLIWRTYVGIDTRADALLVGCLLGLAASWDWLPRGVAAARVSGALAAACALGFAYFIWYRSKYDTIFNLGLFTLAATMAAAIVTRLLIAPSRGERLVLEWAPLVFIGKISYGLYLFHFPIMGVVNLPLGWRNPGNTLLVASVSAAAAVASYFLIERPFLAMKHRFRPPMRTPEVVPDGVPGKANRRAA